MASKLEIIAKLVDLLEDEEEGAGTDEMPTSSAPNRGIASTPSSSPLRKLNEDRSPVTPKVLYTEHGINGKLKRHATMQAINARRRINKRTSR